MWNVFEDQVYYKGEKRAIMLIYESHKGWMSTTTGIQKFGDLPQAAQNYIFYLEELMNTRISIISIGPGRDEILRR